jgi:hypothetical protein
MTGPVVKRAAVGARLRPCHPRRSHHLLVVEALRLPALADGFRFGRLQVRADTSHSGVDRRRLNLPAQSPPHFGLFPPIVGTGGRPQTGATAVESGPGWERRISRRHSPTLYAETLRLASAGQPARSGHL